MKKFLLRIIVLAVSFLVAFACMAGCTGDKGRYGYRGIDGSFLAAKYHV